MDLHNNKLPLTRYRLMVVGIPTLLFLGYVLRYPILNMIRNLPPCPFYRYFHILCPACGNTRSLASFLDGNLLLALHYNPVPYLILFFGLLAYVQLCFYAMGKSVQLLPQKLSFYLILIGLVLAYLIGRNFIPVLFPQGIS